MLLIVASTRTGIKTRASKAFTENDMFLFKMCHYNIIASTETGIKTRGSKPSLRMVHSGHRLLWISCLINSSYKICDEE